MYLLPFGLKHGAALVPRRQVKAAAPSGPSPSDVLDEINSIFDALDDLDGAETEDEAASIAADLETRIAALPFGDLTVIEDDAWNDVEAAMADLVDRLAEGAGEDPLDREMKRRRLLDDIIVDGFYYGLWYAGKAAYWTLKQVVVASIEAGRIAAPHVARAASAAASAAGDVAVDAYERVVNGVSQTVSAHSRTPPGDE